MIALPWNLALSLLLLTTFSTEALIVHVDVHGESNITNYSNDAPPIPAQGSFPRRLVYRNSPSSQAADIRPEGVPIKEIHSVELEDVSEDSPLRSEFWWSGSSNIYVEFSHRGMHRGKSIYFDDLLNALVSVPLHATYEGMQEPVKCTIKRTRPLRKDEILFTADIVLRDDVDEVSSPIRDLKGRDTGAKIIVGVFRTKWVAGTAVDGCNPECSMGAYFEGGLRSLQHLAKKFYVGGTEELQKPVQEANPDMEIFTLLDGLIEYPKDDEFVPLIWEISRLAPFFGWILPFDDQRDNPLSDRASMCNEIRTKNLLGLIVEPYEGRWVEPLSDASMTRIFFSSLGSFLVRKVTIEDRYHRGTEYVVDMMYLRDLEYRDGYENLGCKVFFDSNSEISMIEDHDGSLYHPRDNFWEWAKLKARSAVFVYASVEHLMWYHMIYANIPGMSLRMFLPPDHPVRLALTPHFFRTHSTCNQAEHLLVVEKGIIHRALPFQYKGGLEKFYTDMMTSFQFSTYPVELEQRGMMDNEHHIGTDGVFLHGILSRYVSNLVDEIYPDKMSFMADPRLKEHYEFMSKKIRGVTSEFNMSNFKMVWGEILFRVTGAHTSVGNVAIYALEPFSVNFRMKEQDKGKVVGSREAIAVMSLISGISLPAEYPNLSQDWSHVIHDSESRAYAQLKAELVELGQTINERNTARRFASLDYHPDHVAISIFS